MFDIIIVGAGPIGLEAAIRAKRANLNYIVFDKGCIVNAIANYPTYMTFFTTSERLEIGNHPLVTATDKPTRKESLDYYRKVVANEGLNIAQYSEVVSISKENDVFELIVNNKNTQKTYQSKIVILATGYFDNPKKLGVEGEDLANFSHYYTEAHPYYQQNVSIIGAGSGSADAALELFKAGAKVTIIHRGSGFRHSLKYWIRPNLENRVKEGSIIAHFNTVVKRIESDKIIALKDGREIIIPTDQTFALTGYFASSKFLEQLGAQINSDDMSAVMTKAYETTVPNLFALGSAGFGTRTSDVFIENGLVHVEKAMQEIQGRF